MLMLNILEIEHHVEKLDNLKKIKKNLKGKNAVTLPSEATRAKVNQITKSTDLNKKVTTLFGMNINEAENIFNTMDSFNQLSDLLMDDGKITVPSTYHPDESQSSFMINNDINQLPSSVFFDSQGNEIKHDFSSANRANISLENLDDEIDFDFDMDDIRSLSRGRSVTPNTYGKMANIDFDMNMNNEDINIATSGLSSSEAMSTPYKNNIITNTNIKTPNSIQKARKRKREHEDLNTEISNREMQKNIAAKDPYIINRPVISSYSNKRQRLSNYTEYITNNQFAFYNDNEHINNTLKFVHSKTMLFIKQVHDANYNEQVIQWQNNYQMLQDDIKQMENDNDDIMNYDMDFDMDMNNEATDIEIARARSRSASMSGIGSSALEIAANESEVSPEKINRRRSSIGAEQIEFDDTITESPTSANSDSNYLQKTGLSQSFSDIMKKSPPSEDTEQFRAQISGITSVFRNILNNEFETTGRDVIEFSTSLENFVKSRAVELSRRDAALSFQQLLLLVSMSEVFIEQKEAFGTIHIAKGRYWY